MKKFETLLALIKTALPAVVQKRIDTLRTEIAKLPELEAAQLNSPSDENQEALDKQNAKILEIEETVEVRLQAILDKQTEIEDKLKNPSPDPTPTPNPEPTPTPNLEPNPTPNPEPTPTPNPEPTPAPKPAPTPAPNKESKSEKKSNGLLYFFGAVAVLALTAGAVNILKNKS